MTVTFAWYELNTFFLKFRRILVECLIKLNFQGNHYIDVFDIIDTLPGFSSSTFLYRCPPPPPPKIHFFYSLLNPVSPWSIPKVDSEGEKKLKFVSLDRRKMHFRHSSWPDCRSIACTLLIKMIFFQWISVENTTILSSLPEYFFCVQ